jgi:alcohol dehydrogenase
LSIAQIARYKGARKIIISDPSPIAKKVIAHYPAFEIIDPSGSDLNTAVGSAKFAAIFDSVGTVETMKSSIPFLEEAGTYVNLTVQPAAIEINALALGSERSVTTSSNAYYSDLKEAFELLDQGLIDVDPWITHRFPLEDFNSAFDLLTQSPKAAYKVVFEPWRKLSYEKKI